jgi:hypothetical protein
VVAAGAGGPETGGGLAGQGVEALAGWLNLLTQRGARGSNDRVGLELAVVQMATGPAPPVLAPVEVAARPASVEQGGAVAPRPAPVPAAKPEVKPVQQAPVSEPVARTVEALEASWDQVEDGARGHGGAAIEALLRSCRPVAVDEETVTIGARFAFHADKLTEPEAKLAVEQALADLLGGAVAVEVTVAESAAEDPVQTTEEQAKPVEAEVEVPAEFAGDPVVTAALVEMGARVVERSDASSPAAQGQLL